MSKRDPGFPAMLHTKACRIAGLLAAFIFSLLPYGALYATEGAIEPQPPWLPQVLGAQATFIYQNMPAFHSPYIGEDSLRFDHGLGRELTQTYGLYLGSQLTESLQAYVDFEMFRGQGLSKGLGLGGYTNGDEVRAGTADLGQGPYLARLFARYLIPLSGELGGESQASMDQLPGREPVDRIEIKGGKLAPPDDFDQNRYASNQRSQFLNYAFLYNPAWDYASDTRGYTIGAVAAIVHPFWRLALGSYQINTQRNGYILDSDILRARGDNVELTLSPGNTVVRLLVYRNEGSMGDFRDALFGAATTGGVPDTTVFDTPGHVRYGAGLNVEQPLADKGETGLFARIGWQNGTNSAWSYTEVDRTASVGLQVAGSHWGRDDDRFGIACAAQGLTGSHRHYLAAGGVGLLLGDGALNYGLEEIFEAYYRIQLGRYVQLSPDYQHLWNPAYNRARGPVDVYGIRLRICY